MKKQKNKEFDIFIGILLDSYRQFSYWDYLSKSLSKNNTVENKVFWFTVVDSLLRSSLLGLARIFERQNGRFNDVLSIYYLIDSEFLEFENTLKKIKDIRDKILTHSEVKILMDIGDFIKKIRLTPEMVRDLFVKTIKVTNSVRSNYHLSGEIFYMFDDVEKKAQKEINNLFNN